MYSSLSYLRRYPVDVLKIDRTFLIDVGQDPVGTRLLAGVTDLAHILGLSVTAEGVETERQRAEVAAIGCEQSQGFFYARPIPADQIARLLRDTTGHALHLPVQANEPCRPPGQHRA